MAIGTRERPITAIVSDVGNQIALLVRKEGELAGAELAENLKAAVRGAIVAIVGAVLLIPALVILLMAAVDALIQAGLAGWAASLIVGGVVLILGVILMIVGANRLSADTLTPKKTLRQLRRDAAVPTMVEDDELQRAA